MKGDGQDKQIALVTGSARGIGDTTVAALGKRGFHVMGVDQHEAEIIADPVTVVPRAACGPAELWKPAEAIAATAGLKPTFPIGQTDFVDGGTAAIRVPDSFLSGIACAP